MHGTPAHFGFQFNNSAPCTHKHTSKTRKWHPWLFSKNKINMLFSKLQSSHLTLLVNTTQISATHHLFSIHGIAKSSLCACNAVTFIQMIQNSYQRAHDAGLDLQYILQVQSCTGSPIWQLHWNNKGYIEHGLVQNKATCPLLWQSPILPGNYLPNCLLGEQDLAPSRRGFHSNNQDFAKQALMHCISTLTSKALAIECMGSKYKTHEELDGN